METLFVRLKPYDPRRGYVLRRYTYRGIKFHDERGWFRVPKDVAEYLRAVHQSPGDEHSPLAFDVCSGREITMSDLAWHLTAETLLDERPIPAVGEWLRHEGEIDICRSGLHASRRLLDALAYAPYAACWIHRVEVRGVSEEHNDKLVARERRIIASHSLDLRRVVRLACESASLAAWCSGEYLQQLIDAANAADAGDFEAARDAAVAAVAAAGDAAVAAVAAAGDAARDTVAAARAAGYAACHAIRSVVRYAAGNAVRETLERRAIELLTGDNDE